MPTLMERAEAVNAGLGRVRAANQARQHLATLQQRSQEWGKLKRRQEQLREAWSRLTAAPWPVELEKAHAAVGVLATQAGERLRARDVQALTEDTLWKGLLESADAAIRASDEAIRSCWRGIIEECGDVSPPQVLQDMAPKTPSNDVALVEYRRAFTIYASLSNQAIPADATPTTSLKNAIASMRQARESLTLTAPPEILAFLNAVEAGGAALALLTPQVMTWLNEHDDPQRFTIKLRSGTQWC